MKKILSIVLTFVMLVLPMAEMTALAAPSAVTVADGAYESMPVPEVADLASDPTYIGDGLTWTFDDVTGTLTVSGEGEMTDFWSTSEIPWFNFREDVKHAVFEDGVTNVPYSIFYDCQNLETVTFGKDIEEIDSGFIDACNTVKSFAVSADNNYFYTDKFGVLYSKEYGFIELVKYPGGSERTSYVIPDGVVTISSSAFQFSNNLTSVTVGDDVECIEYRAFSNCSALESFEIPDSVWEIHQYFLDNCVSLKTLKIGSGLCEAWDNAFDFMPALESITVSADNDYFSSDKDGVLYNKNKTEVIKFPKGKKVTSFTIPDGVTVIGENSFENIETLESIYIPDSVTTIGIGAFSWCTNLDTVTGAENVLEVEERAFSHTGFVENDANWDGNLIYLGKCLVFAKDFEYGDTCVIKDGTKVIADSAFSWYGCNGLCSVVIPDSVVSIGNGAFFGCADLENITIGDNVDFIGWDAFSDTAYYYDENNWDNGVLYVGKYLLEADYVVGDYKVKDGTILVCDEAFNNQDHLTGIEFPDSVKRIGKDAFYYCSGLKNITFGQGLEIIDDYAFYECIALESLTFPDSLVTIGYCAFSSCQKVTDITFGKGLKSIGESAFYYCRGLETLVFPDGLESIGNCAFESCRNLKKATFGPAIKEIDYSAFDDSWDFEIHGYVNTAAQTYADDYDIKFVAREDAGYYVSYDAAGGTGAPEGQTKEKNKTLYLSTVVPTREGYTFKGWATKVGGKVLYAPGAKYTANASITLYAVWEGGLKLSDDYTTKVQIKDGTMSAPGLYVKADGRKLTVTLGGIAVGGSYLTNRSSSGRDDFEYNWMVEIRSDNNNWYSVSTSCWAFEPGLNEYITLEDMQHSLWYESKTSGEWIDDAKMTHTYDSMTWTVTIPEDFHFDIDETTQFVAHIEDVDGTDIHRTYNVAQGILYADKVEFVAPSSTSLAVGKSLTLKASASRNDGRKPENNKVTFSIVEGADCATIDASTGKLTGVKSGLVTVRATAVEGTETAFADVVINVCVPATKVILNTTKASMIVGGKELCLEATILPSDSTDTITWSVDKPEIATVDENGVVTAIKAGKAKITALAGSGKKATCSITVGEPATKVEFTSLKSTALAVGKTLSLKAKAGRDDKIKPVSTDVTFEIVKGEEFAKIDAKGKLTALDIGRVVVRATAVAGTEEAYAEIEINVCIPATKVTLNMTKATMVVGDEVFLEADMMPELNTDTVTWSSDKPGIAAVDENGVVTALTAGKAKITALTGSGKKATCSVTVGEPATKVEFTSLKSTSLAVGKTLSLKAKAGRDDKIKPVSTEVVFEIVSGEDFATIDAKGKLKGIDVGEVVVRATAVAPESKETYAEVTINVCIPATKVTLNMTKATVSAGEGLQLKATMSPDNNSDTLSWSTSNKDIASVDKNGYVTTYKEGSVKITATSGSGKKATCTIKVEKAEVLAVLPKLSLKDVTYTFVEDDFIIESNPGAVGGMRVNGLVTGPSDVKLVLVATWGTKLLDMSENEIAKTAANYADMWKGMYIPDVDEFPLYMGITHPVDEDELHGNLQALLIGLDKDCNAVAYAIIEQ